MELGKVKLEKIVAEEIRRFLKEELSIADEVKTAAEDITKIICKGEFEFTYPLYDIGEYTIVVVPIEVEDEEYSADGETRPKDMVITIQIPLFHGMVLKNSVYRTLHHELEHLYQVVKKGNASWGKYKEVYNKSIELFGKTNDYATDRICQYIYSCSTFEQDAFVNDLYAQLMRVPFFSEKYVTEAVYNSNSYKALNIIRDVKADMTNPNNGTDYTKAMNEFNRPHRWFVYLGNNAEKRLIQKIRHVIVKSGIDRMGREISNRMNLNAIITL